MSATQIEYFHKPSLNIAEQNNERISFDYGVSKPN